MFELKTIYISDCMSDSSEQTWPVLECCLSAEDVNKAASELRRYMSKRGRVYANDPQKEPRLSFFVAAYFGESDYDEYVGQVYTAPARYTCTNKNVARRLYDLLKGLEYHDTYNQTYCTVELEGNHITVEHGDY